MITIRQMHPSGGWSASALVRDTKTHEVFLHTERYYDYGKSEVRKLFIASLMAKHLVMVNDV